MNSNPGCRCYGLLGLGGGLRLADYRGWHAPCRIEFPMLVISLSFVIVFIALGIAAVMIIFLLLGT